MGDDRPDDSGTVVVGIIAIVIPVELQLRHEVSKRVIGKHPELNQIIENNNRCIEVADQEELFAVSLMLSFLDVEEKNQERWMVQKASSNNVTALLSVAQKFSIAKLEDLAKQYVESTIDYHNLTEPHALEETMLQVLQQRQRPAGVYFVPRPVQVRDDHNFTSLQWDRTVVDASGRLFTPQQDVELQNPFWKLQHKQVQEDRVLDRLPLTTAGGRVALRLYSRAVPGMAEMSVVDGSVKIMNRHSQHMT